MINKAITAVLLLALTTPQMTTLHHVHTATAHGMGCPSGYAIWHAHFSYTAAGPSAPIWQKLSAATIPPEQERSGLYRCWLNGVTPR